NMGEHGLWWKNSMYEQSARVPMIISYPKRWKGGQRRTLASGHVDLVKTIIDLAGGKAPTDWNGDSLLPWLNDSKYKWKDLACSEYYAHFIAHGLVMLRTGKWKYIYHGKPADNLPAERELFNMEVDPNEFHNVANDPRNAKLIADLHQRLIKEVGGDPNITEQRARQQLTAGYPESAFPRSESGEGG
ncbi:MAG: sulfatase/phosphatase domain-containing protein, partial [Bryocella sp.]